MAQTMQNELIIELGAKDLPLHCPMPGTPLWCATRACSSTWWSSGEALCPYCGTKYLYKGPAPKGHEAWRAPPALRASWWWRPTGSATR